MKTITWFWEKIGENPKAYLNVLVWELCDHNFCPDTDSPESEDYPWWEVIDQDYSQSNEDGDLDPREIVGRAMRDHRVHRLEEFGVEDPPESLYDEYMSNKGVA